jgi:hypothetical protein
MNTKTKKYIVLIAVVAIAIVGIVFFTRGKKSSSAANSIASNTNVSSAENAATLSKELEFPIKNEKGEEVSRFKYTIETVEVRDEIIVKGQKVTALSGRTFLIVNLKLVNPLDKMIQIHTKDYIRLIRNGNPAEALAPDVHNDPVEVQAISTKMSRVAFPINDSDTDLQLQIGEIAGEKQVIPIAFN